MTPEQLERARANGKTPYWRFLLDGRTVEWSDDVLGRRTVKLPSLSDPVLIRARRHAALHLHLRRGRPGKRRHAHRARRGPRHQHRRADRPLGGARRRPVSAPLRAPAAAPGRRWRAAVEAPRQPLACGSCGATGSSPRRSPGTSRRSAPRRTRCRGCRASSWSASTSAPCRTRRRGSTRSNSWP